MVNMNVYKSFSGQDYKLGIFQEQIEFWIYAILSYFVPFLMGHPQLLVGTIVNSALILGAFNLKGWKLLPIIVLPSAGVISAGLIFGPFTYALLYIMPFIWVGNLILVISFKALHLTVRWNKIVTLVVGTLLKTGFLFTSAYLLIQMNLIPAAMLGAMGLLQIYTALMGGAIAISVQTIKKRI